jgi:hypothetical protein
MIAGSTPAHPTSKDLSDEKEKTRIYEELIHRLEDDQSLSTKRIGGILRWSARCRGLDIPNIRRKENHEYNRILIDS